MPENDAALLQISVEQAASSLPSWIFFREGVREHVLFLFGVAGVVSQLFGKKLITVQTSKRVAWYVCEWKQALI